MRAFLLGTGLAALAFAAAQAVPTDSFTPDSAGQYAAERAPEAGQARTALTAAERLRAGLVLNPRGVLEGLSPLERQVLQAAFGQLGPREATHMAWYFRGAIARPSTAGSNRILLYNPLADIATLTVWRQVDGVWRLTSARLVDGAVLRPAHPDFWADAAGEPYRLALVTRAAGTLNTRTGALPASGAEGAFERLRARSNNFAAGIARWRSHARQSVAEDIRSRLAAGANPAAEGPGPDRIAALSADVRRTLALVGAVRRQDGDSLIFASPLRPDLLIFVDLDAGERPLRTGAVNLSVQGAPTP